MMTRDTELVAQHNACPQCGEDRQDWLVWDEDGETVTCGTCGCQYTP